MSKRNYLDVKTINKHARELRKKHKADYKGLNYFIADFYCDAKKAVKELDGSIHDEKEEYDQFRDEEMKSMGLHILRLKNEELSEMNITIEKIISYLNTIV